MLKYPRCDRTGLNWRTRVRKGVQLTAEALCRQQKLYRKSSQNRLQRKRAAKATLKRVLEHPKTVLSVHYSSESFYDRPAGASPRITSIAIRHFDSGQTISLSIHQAAEELGVLLDELTPRYAEVEREMLARFFEFVRRHSH